MPRTLRPQDEGGDVFIRQTVAVKFDEWTSVDVQMPIFTKLFGVCWREWKSMEVLGSGEKVGRVGIEPTTN